MKNISLISDVSTLKRQLETTFDGNSQKRLHVDDESEFFGLPNKVKHLFKKHKKITQLYGLNYFISDRFRCIYDYLFVIILRFTCRLAN